MDVTHNRNVSEEPKKKYISIPNAHWVPVSHILVVYQQTKQTIWFLTKMVYSSLRYTRFFPTRYNVTLYHFQTTTVHKIKNKKIWIQGYRKLRNVMGIHHTVHKPSLKSHRRVNCFLDQNEMCGNTFRNGRMVLNSMAWPSVDLQTDRILGKLNEQMLLPTVGLVLSSHWRKFWPFLLVLTLKIDASSTRKHFPPLLLCSRTVTKVRGEEIWRKTRQNVHIIRSFLASTSKAHEMFAQASVGGSLKNLQGQLLHNNEERKSAAKKERDRLYYQKNKEKKIT